MTSCTLLAIASLLAGAAHAGPVLFDFENDAELEAWVIRDADQDKLERVAQFATSGEYSMRFTTPAWKQGMGEWPAFEVKPPEADWSGYDRLMVDIVNPADQYFFLSLFVSDSKVPFRESLSYGFQLPEAGYRRFIIPLAGLPEKVDRKDISIVHFFTQRPAADMTLYLDNLRLLAPGEEPPAPREGSGREIAELTLDRVAASQAVLDSSRAELAELGDAPGLMTRVDALQAWLDGIRRTLTAPEVTIAQVQQAKSDLDRLPGASERLIAEGKFEAACNAAEIGAPAMLVGFSTSMVKLLPREMPFEVDVRRSMELSLARNEKEAFQVAVMPRGEALRGVELSVTDLKTEAGEVLSAEQVDCDVMGYVKTEGKPPYAVSHIGWWPDPILDFLGPIDIQPGDLQSFWVRVRAPKTQAAGEYEGTLTVSAQGVEPVQFPLTVTVRSFTLPDHTSLPTAITYFQTASRMVGEEEWARMKLVWADFLADYQIDYDSLYRSGPPDFEVVQHLHRQGKLVAFNLGNVFNAGTSEEGFDQAIADTIERLRPGYEKAKELGLLPYAYIYGFDERPKEQFGLLERSAQALKKAFPEVLLMTTSYDHSFGLESEVKTMDAWCPLTPSFKPDVAEEAREAGKKVWWYICCGPHNPFANWFVEYAAIESRLLMGAMTAKYRPDGFLYYSLDIWNANQPIETGPFTQWNPVSWTTYHGDGSLICAGPGGKPVPTIRLENYRDGMEDFAYACILEEAIRRVEARGELSEPEKAWLEEAKEAVVVPESLVKSMAEYSHDPAELYAYRERVARLIEDTGLTDLNPWGDGFGVRGFGG